MNFTFGQTLAVQRALQDCGYAEVALTGSWDAATVRCYNLFLTDRASVHPALVEQPSTYSLVHDSLCAPAFYNPEDDAPVDEPVIATPTVEAVADDSSASVEVTDTLQEEPLKQEHGTPKKRKSR